MAKKKKSSSVPTASAIASSKNSEPTTDATAASDEVESENEEESEDEGEDDEEVELLQVEVGDIIKLKQVLDEAVVETFLESSENSNLDFEEDQYWDNIKLTLMALSCIFAALAQFSPIPFPDSRPLLAVCCVAYFSLSGILQLIATFVDKDAILVTTPVKGDNNDRAKKNPELSKYGLRVRSCLPKYDEYYTVVIQFQGLENSPFVTKTWSVGKFFDVDGMFYEVGLMEQVEKLYKRFENGKYDKEEIFGAAAIEARKEKKKSKQQ